MNWEDIAGSIDAALLRPDCTRAELIILAEEAVSFGYRAICVPSYLVAITKQILDGTKVRVCSAIGFPFGYCSLPAKLYEVASAVNQGADDIDYVVNLSAYLSDGVEPIMMEAEKIIAQAKADSNVVVKAIIEVGYLNRAQLTEVSKACASAGVDYLKTSTGFGPRGVTVEDIKIMKAATGGTVPIKAAGGIRTLEQVIEIFEAGASIIGTSQAKQIILEAQRGGSQ